MAGALHQYCLEEREFREKRREEKREKKKRKRRRREREEKRASATDALVAVCTRQKNKARVGEGVDITSRDGKKRGKTRRNQEKGRDGSEKKEHVLFLNQRMFLSLTGQVHHHSNIGLVFKLSNIVVPLSVSVKNVWYIF